MEFSIAQMKQNKHLFSEIEIKLIKTDPEFMHIFQNFAFDEVINQNDLDDRT